MRQKTAIDKIGRIKSLVQVCLSDADSFYSLTKNKGISPFIAKLTDWIRMPERAVRFNSQIVVGQEKINSISPDFIFSNKGDLQVFQCLSYKSLRTRLAPYCPDTVARTKSSVDTDRRFTGEFLLTPLAYLNNVFLECFPQAFARAVQWILRPDAKEFPTANLTNVGLLCYSCFVVALARTMDSWLTFIVTFGRKYLFALRANFRFRLVPRSLITSASAEPHHSIAAGVRQNLAAIFASKVFKYRSTFLVFTAHPESLILPRFQKRIEGFCYGN